MDFLAATAGIARDIWRTLPALPVVGAFIKPLLSASLLAGAIFVIVYVIERRIGARSGVYRSRAFFHDLLYWFYYRTGMHSLLLVAPVAVLLERPLSSIATGLLTPLPYPVHVLIVFIASDFAAYWIHRAEHRFKFMWAFHTTHHSQEQLNFATIARFHPVEMFYHNIIVFIPLRILGLDPTAWLPLFLLNHLHGGLVHTQIPWKLGPFYKIIATPSFHSYHHSMDPAHHDKNFSSVFSMWDYIFGTAIEDSATKPSRFGLKNIPGGSLLSSLTTPFRLLYEFYVVPLLRRHAGKP